jgi:muconate cycloisomerase
MAEVTRASSVPIVADESCWNVADALAVSEQRGADCLSIYLAKAGGFAEAMTVGAIAHARQMSCDVNGSIESAIGNAANLHFAFASPAVSLASVIPVSAPAGTHPWKVAGRYYEDDIVRQPFGVKDGALLALDAPGLGIEIDEAALARHRCG